MLLYVFIKYRGTVLDCHANIMFFLLVLVFLAVLHTSSAGIIACAAACAAACAPAMAATITYPACVGGCVSSGGVCSPAPPATLAACFGPTP